MSNWRRIAALAIALVVLAGLVTACSGDRSHTQAQDEAKQAGRSVASFPMADDDYFRDMDPGVEMSREAIIGRNMWMVWSGGNDRFWDEFSRLTLGGFDLLKIISTHPSQKLNRQDRWFRFGLVNEPCFRQPTEDDMRGAHGKETQGLWLDVRDPSCPKDPFDDPKKYPGLVLDEKGEALGSYYGKPTGIVGLRLFPNPKFDKKAAGEWDAENYYCVGATRHPRCRDVTGTRLKEPTSDLVRPYRVGMSCAFCHAGPSPIRPPQDAANPAWSNIVAIVGAQFMNVREVFLPNLKDSSFLSQILKSYREGSLDTSLVGTDSINNPRTMNAIYSLNLRMEVAKRMGHEKLAGGALHSKQINDFVKDGPMTEFFKRPDTVFTPHILKDGADSIGPLGALNRVYVNVGMFSEEWLKHFNPVIGGRGTSPFEIEKAQVNSIYWQVTEANTINLLDYFLRVGEPDLLKDTKEGKEIIEREAAAAERGKTVFAEVCARCHTGKPGPVPPQSIRTCREHKDHLACFKEWWSWTKTDDYKREMTRIVRDPDYSKNNYFSSEVRIPVTLLRTNACSPLASNAIAGHVWDNFSSQTYKELPPVGAVSVRDPFTGARGTLDMPGGGRGYTRVPSLISLWSTAPFLLNNSLGTATGDPLSVEGRLRTFDSAVEELLWPEKRKTDSLLADKGVGWIDRTSEPSYIFAPARYVPQQFLFWPKGLGKLGWWPEFFSKEGNITLGPVPKDLPVNLLANVRLVQETPRDRFEFLISLPTLAWGLDRGVDLVRKKKPDKDIYKHYKRLSPTLLRLSNCKDFEVNRGHYFGTAKFNDSEGLTEDEKAYLPDQVLTDDQKQDLKAFLKTL